jgi:hypothetical protein
VKSAPAFIVRVIEWDGGFVAVPVIVTEYGRTDAPDSTVTVRVDGAVPPGDNVTLEGFMDAVTYPEEVLVVSPTEPANP